LIALPDWHGSLAIPFMRNAYLMQKEPTMRQFHSVISCAGFASLLLCSAGSAFAQGAPSALPPAVPGTAPVIAPLIRLDPTEIRTRPTMAAGCWVWLFPKKNYKGPDDIAIAGPVEVRSLHTPIGLDWNKHTESLIVGPKAVVTVFETGNFADRQATLKPGTRLTSLRSKLRFTQSIDSLKVACKS
jgi:hypothetical protein